MGPLWPSIAGLIEFAGALIVMAYVVRAMLSLLRRNSIDQARFLVAQGALAGLGFKTAATLLKALQLADWEQIGMFVALFTLRMILKKAFQMEQGRRTGRALAAR